MRWIKRLGIIVAVLLVLLAVLLGVVYMYIDSIARKGVEVGGTYALGVPTTLDKASVGIFQGHVGISGLTVANPEGFTSPYFMKLGDGKVDVKLSSLRGDTVDVPSIELNGFDVHLEKQQGKTNYGVIQDNLKKLQSTEAAQPAQPAAQPGKKFIIHDLKLTGIVAHVNLVGFASQLTALDNIALDPIELHDVGTANGAGMHMEDLAGTIVKAIMLAVANKLGSMGGEMAKMVGSDLNDGLKGLNSLASQGISVVGDPGGKLANFGVKAGDILGAGVGSVGKGAGLDKLPKGLGGLIGGGEPTTKPSP